MERKVVLYIAMSLDGYIARSNGAVDWLSGHGDVEEVDNGYEDFYSTIDTIVMGRTTYEQVVNELSPEVWIYEGKKCYVFTNKEYEDNEKVEFTSEDISEFHEFVRKNLIDKYIITVIPTILGEGIPLFLKGSSEIKLKLVESKSIDGMVELTYIKQ